MCLAGINMFPSGRCGAGQTATITTEQQVVHTLRGRLDFSAPQSGLQDTHASVSEADLVTSRQAWRLEFRSPGTRKKKSGVFACICYSTARAARAAETGGSWEHTGLPTQRALGSVGTLVSRDKLGSNLGRHLTSASAPRPHTHTTHL